MLGHLDGVSLDRGSGEAGGLDELVASAPLEDGSASEAGGVWAL
ncbi:MAG TPA: hypothetical protein QGF58_03225 [Myxococcota bacterium]|nr:hypothetical protein [Myxococcota bacterium]